MRATNICQAAMGEAKIVEFQILSQVFTNKHGQESATCCGEMRGKLGRLKKHMIAMYRNEIESDCYIPLWGPCSTFSNSPSRKKMYL
jgi:hypothetical protein